MGSGQYSESPASKAFANRLAKYAYIDSGPSTSSSTASTSRVLRGSAVNKSAITHEHEDPTGKMPGLEATKTRGGGTKNSRPDNDQQHDNGGYRPSRPTGEVQEQEISDANERDEDEVGTSKKKKRKRTAEPAVSSGANGKAKAKGKIPRGYAPPEAYEHLRPVNDLLREGLDIVFCGINPGKRSSTIGHHFSHPTNKFWRSLHQSGLTSRLLDPTEDHLMVDEFNFGLTNLVDRPTSEQSELSTLEMRLNVYNLTQKFLKHRPQVVCFVGKKIWDVYESVVRKTAVPIMISDEDDDNLADRPIECTPRPIKFEVGTEPSSPADHDRVKVEQGLDDHSLHSSVLSRPSSNPEPTAQKDIKPDLESYDHDPLTVFKASSVAQSTPPPSPLRQAKEDEISGRSSPSPRKASTSSNSRTRTQSPTAPVRARFQPFDPTQPRRFRLPHTYTDHHDTKHGLGGDRPESKRVRGWTYFWVVPNTSGLERTQLPQQIINFTALRLFTEQLNNGWQPPSDKDKEGWKDIILTGVRQTVDHIHAIGSAEGSPLRRSSTEVTRDAS
ncbi:hypothetical protein IAT40_000201 [Kwoniella sp. CBS 6097]